MTLRQAIASVLTSPTPEGLWELRTRLLERLLSPALSGETDGTTKAVLLGLLFQVLVLHHLSPYLASAA